MDYGIKSRPRKQKQGEIFEECFPYYLTIGMTAEEYWCGDPSLTRGFRKAYEMKQKQMDEEAWLHGLYFYDALCSVMSCFNTKSDSHKEYATKPYSSVEKEVDEDSKKKEAEAQAEVWMKSWASATQKAFKDK